MIAESEGPGILASTMDELLDRAPCGFVSFGDDGAITAMNATLAERLGLDRQQQLGRHVETILTLPTRLFYQTHLFPLLKMHGQAREIFLFLRTADGEQVGVLCNARRYERQGTWAYDCVFLEVQERRKFEEALLRAKHEAEEASRALEARSSELEQANALLEEQAVELELQHQQLQEQAIEMEAQQEQLQMVADDLLQQTEELERARRKADDANRAKSSFLAAMSHELRTPLNAIGGYLQLLEMGVHGPVTDVQRETLLRIDRSQRHLLRLINDVLDLSRIESGRVEYLIESFSVEELVRGVLPMVEPQAQAQGLQLDVAIPAGLVIRADREKAQQVLLNLLGNAIKFTAAGGSVRVTAERHEGHAAPVVLHVTDTGSGIPADQIDGIFEPFVQVDAAHRPRSEGSGLGLAISRDLARGMGGDLSATSVVGEGSTFTLALPAG